MPSSDKNIKIAEPMPSPDKNVKTVEPMPPPDKNIKIDEPMQLNRCRWADDDVSFNKNTVFLAFTLTHFINS